MISIFSISTLFIVSLLFFINYRKIASKLKLIDNKNPNYNFKPTPTGAGLIFPFFFLVCNFLLFFNYNINNFPNNFWVFLISGTLLSLVSFYDDIKPIDPILRLVIQILLIFFSLTVISIHEIVPLTKIAFLICVIIWIYIMNIANFLDGSDGFLSIIYLFISFQILIACHFLEGLNIFSYYVVLSSAPIVIFFFIFNKPPAKIYMGDAGSIFLGYLLGFIFLEFLSYKKFFLILAIFAYPIFDCSITLLKKLRKGIMPWVGMYDYYFLKPILKNKKNHINVMIIYVIFGLLNSLNIYLMLKYNLNYFFILSYILAYLNIFIYKNLENKLSYFKFFK